MHKGVLLMDDKELTTAPAAESGDIMQHIQDMVGGLLRNSVGKMHKTEVGEKIGTSPGDVNEIPAQMNLTEIKTFIDVMQKFIDNVSVMVLQLETGNTNAGGTDEKFIDGYMATADNVLEMAAFSMKDSLTGISNRYGFDNRLILEWNRATRDKTTLSLVFFNVGGLENAEDKKREDVLIAISKKLEDTIKRATDFIARWGDEEFAVLLPITEEVGASIVAERIRVEIGNVDVPGIAEKDGKLPVSIGIYASTPDPAEKPIDFINKAYDAFTSAKEADGGSIVFA